MGFIDGREKVQTLLPYVFQAFFDDFLSGVRREIGILFKRKQKVTGFAQMTSNGS